MYYERATTRAILRQKNREISQAKENQNITPVVSEGGFWTHKSSAKAPPQSEFSKKVRDSANKVKSLGISFQLIAGLSVLLVFMFLQYNRVIFGAVAAYTTPGAINPQNIIIDASTDMLSDLNLSYHPKINVDAPVIYSAASDTNRNQKPWRRGSSLFNSWRRRAVPGEVGNAVFAALSNDAFAGGDYKFVFAQMKVGQRVMYLHELQREATLINNINRSCYADRSFKSSD